MVVAPPLLSKIPALPCIKCSSQDGGLPLCQQCGAIQPIPEGINYYQVLGLPVSPVVDLLTLQDHFISLSKKIHPDRYVNSADLPHSERWSTYVNRACQTLKSSEDRWEYLLSLYGVSEKGASCPPLDLSEQFFEYQELMGSHEGRARASVFLTDLITHLAEIEARWEMEQGGWKDETRQKKILEDLREDLNRRKYIQTMITHLSKGMGDA